MTNVAEVGEVRDVVGGVAGGVLAGWLRLCGAFVTAAAAAAAGHCATLCPGSWQRKHLGSAGGAGHCAILCPGSRHR